MNVEDVVQIISGWQEAYTEEGAALRKMQNDLKAKDIGCVQIFEVGKPKHCNML
jgi:hypothetical protein